MENLEVSQLSPSQIARILLKDLDVFDNSSYLLKPFDVITIDFFDSFSKNILSNKSINHLPEIAALGFWLRKANLNQLKAQNSHLFVGASYRTSPLGKVFHVCPANVDTMFIYSLTVSVLMGNKNILRVSSRMEAPHVKMLFDILNSTIQQEKFTVFKSYINIISYPHNDSISSFISEKVNVRVIWGGDQTIKTFKKFRTSPRTKDIVFADRVSMLCIDCNSYLDLDENEIKGVVRNFYNDAYTFDQMGCSSPQTIYFIGNKDEYKKCIVKFQEDVSDYLKINYDTDLASISSLKLNRMVDDAIEDVIIAQIGDNYIKFLELNTNIDESTLHGCGGGYFYIRNIESTTSLVNLHTPKVQTVSYYGLKESDLKALCQLSNGEGIDRIVPLGQALHFNYIWDGYNLFDELSKKVFIK
ncbi:acyl-CoA reductase [Flavobacterium sp. GT3P67]|uniref:acyl-CoA reductase n=1 Tax=Flavobacterium sp. GT3P67 TaxID=2541722 RepID=UPI00104B8A85|nr:acyl-CoA reductase [Flavobacterium sp. GT3P67]TDE51283.1 hypothetical protein E0H99_11800 [Flavobacterium sp. GT3P67]